MFCNSFNTVCGNIVCASYLYYAFLHRSSRLGQVRNNTPICATAASQEQRLGMHQWFSTETIIWIVSMSWASVNYNPSPTCAGICGMTASQKTNILYMFKNIFWLEVDLSHHHFQTTRVVRSSQHWTSDTFLPHGLTNTQNGIWTDGLGLKQPLTSQRLISVHVNIPPGLLQSSATSVGVVHTSSSTAQSAISTMNIRLKKKQMEVGRLYY